MPLLAATLDAGLPRISLIPYCISFFVLQPSLHAKLPLKYRKPLGGDSLRWLSVRQRHFKQATLVDRPPSTLSCATHISRTGTQE